MRRKYRWTLPDAADDAGSALADALKLPPLVGRLLVSRGFTTAEAARDFLDTGLHHLHDPFAMKGMTAAVARIKQAIAQQEQMRIYGDYDADGVTSTALMHRLLTRLGGVFDTYIPHRSREGYGLNLAAIDLAAEAGVTLLITVDNGISAAEQIAYAHGRGIEVIVTDHHEPPARLPDAAVAIINPKQIDCPYPFKELSGAGVVFKLAHALLGEPDLSLSDVAAIGIVADLMQLVGENRAIVKLGLAEMNRNPSPGVRALAAICGVEAGKLSSGRIAFGLAPRLNAGGRLGSAEGALRLLVTDDEAEAESLAMELDVLNQERQQLVEDTLLEAETAWQARIAAHDDDAPSVIVIAGDGWNAGIAGLVASKLVERYYKPAIVLAHDPESGKCKGSARSIEGFDLFKALTACAEELDHFGGHQAAAGMTMRRDRVEALEHGLSQLAEAWLRPEDWVPRKKADLICRASELTIEAAEQLKALEPYGNGNPTPRLIVREASVGDAKAMGKEGKHLRAVLEQGGRRLETVAFGMGTEAERMKACETVDVLGELSVNEWNGSRRVQLMLQDWRAAALPVFDRRKEQDWFTAVSAMAEAAENGRVVALGTSAHVLARLEALSASALVAAAYADAAQADCSTGEVWLALVDLPDGGPALDGLRQLLTSGLQLEEIHLFASDTAGKGKEAKGTTMPTREQFGEVYGLFRRQVSWIDIPDGFLRQVADRTGWSLAVVRMMQEVFEELGFLRRNRSSLEAVAQPPKKPLDQSERYRKAQLHAEAEMLAAMSPSMLQSWLRKLAKG